jgi:hypothetical protein
MAGSAHGDGKRPPADTYFQWLLDGEEIFTFGGGIAHGETYDPTARCDSAHNEGLSPKDGANKVSIFWVECPRGH